MSLQVVNLFICMLARVYRAQLDFLARSQGTLCFSAANDGTSELFSAMY